jgi:hypothetical protein
MGREELSTAVVCRIENQTRLIPVRLDDTLMPTIINHLRYIVLEPVNEAAREVLKAINGLSSKPAHVARRSCKTPVWPMHS